MEALHFHLREGEIFTAVRLLALTRLECLVRGQTVQCQAPPDAVGALPLRQVTDQMSAAEGGDATLIRRISLEGVALAGVDFLAVDADDRHGRTPRALDFREHERIGKKAEMTWRVDACGQRDAGDRECASREVVGDRRVTGDRFDVSHGRHGCPWQTCWPLHHVHTLTIVEVRISRMTMPPSPWWWRRLPIPLPRKCCAACWTGTRTHPPNSRPLRGVSVRVDTATLAGRAAERRKVGHGVFRRNAGRECGNGTSAEMQDGESCFFMVPSFSDEGSSFAPNLFTRKLHFRDRG